MIRVTAFTAFALAAFALNSVLCRLALRDGEADAAGFTGLRLLAGAVALAAIFYCRGPRMSRGATRNLDVMPLRALRHSGSWISAFFLFAYAACFSFAYLGLTTASGALILFGTVQTTMIAIGIIKGERPSLLEWLGFIIAFGGLVYLVIPGLASPPLINALLMAAAGMAWAAYTLRGKGSDDPLADTTGNFIRSVPMAVLIVVLYFPNLHLSGRGIVLAIISGAVTSGIGYTVWYAVLKDHSWTRVAVLQLSVPVIAAAGGAVFLAEAFTTRLVIAGAVILGGIGMTIIGRRPVT